MARTESAIATIRAYALETGHGDLSLSLSPPPGVRPLHPANYLLAGEWSPADSEGVRIDFPFPIVIGWRELEY